MKNYVFGADVGGTTVKLGLFTTEGELLDKWEIVTRKEPGTDILEDIAASCQTKMEERSLTTDDFAGIGIGVPGPVHSDGSVDVCVNLGWGYRQVRDDMMALMSMPVAVGNDANVAALGEMWLGAARGQDNVVMITLGTGVGGGIIVDGKMISGAHGYGGEIGHIKIHPGETATCGCGGHGCVEQYCSATGITRMAAKDVSGSGSVLEKEEISAKSVFDAAKAGDEYAMQVVDEFADNMALGAAHVAMVADPDVIVIGGGVSKAGEIITDKVSERFKRYVFGAMDRTKFVLATLGNDAGICGCAKLVLR